jgi:hypothetical protein
VESSAIESTFVVSFFSASESRKILLVSAISAEESGGKLSMLSGGYARLIFKSGSFPDKFSSFFPCG